MIKKQKNNKILIIITTILLVILVVVGVAMSMSKKPEKEKENKKEKENNRCVDKVCISKVSIEENEGSKSVNLVIKNEGETKVEGKCVNLVNNDFKFKVCIPELEPTAEMNLLFEYTDEFGKTIKDYGLEAIEEPKEEVVEENTEVAQN